MAPNIKPYFVSEYVKKIKTLYMPVSIFGACNRFDIKDGQIISKSKISLCHSIIVILVVDISAFLILQETAVDNSYLILPEYISVIQFTILSNAMVLNINFSNRHSGADLMRKFIEIDAFLGFEETRFIRRISYKDALIWCIVMGCFEVILITVLGVTFSVSTFTFVAGIIYFMQVFCMAYDIVFHVVSYKLICMRVHYLNVALVKIARLKKEYLTDQLLVYPFLWKKGYDDLVKCRSSADSKYFIDAFKMIFDLIQLTTQCYRFMLFICSSSLMLSTFMAVQCVIIYIKDSEVPVIRTLPLAGWFLMGWTLLVGMTQQTDKFYLQIQRTKLICTYIQLKPNNTDEIYELSKKILDTLSVSDHRYSIYGMYNFDGRLVITLATSVFVYITMQLQIAFPTRIDKKENDMHSNFTYY